MRKSGRRNDAAAEGKPEPPPVVKPARDHWGVLVDLMSVNGELVYALSFHRKGTSIFYLHRHYRDRHSAEQEFDRLTYDLNLPHLEFETKYTLDLSG